MLLENSNKKGTIEVIDSTPTFPRVITVVSTSGVVPDIEDEKENAEAEDEEGCVDLTPEDPEVEP